MNINIPDCMGPVVSNTRDAFVEMLHNPQLWSESMIRRTLERSGTQAFNMQDMQLIIKDYLTCLAECIRKGENV